MPRTFSLSVAAAATAALVTIAAAPVATAAPSAQPAGHGPAGVSAGGSAPCGPWYRPCRTQKAPKNVIVMVGDGMGYNAVAQAGLYKNGRGRGQAFSLGNHVLANNWVWSAFPWQSWSQTGMSTYAVDGSYDPAAAWTDYSYVKKNPTDSSAAGTAMASGKKTYNGAIGMDVDRKPLTLVTERAKQLGKSTGVVSTVPFTHATPASWVAHNESRNNYIAIGSDMIASTTDVIIGAGHPYYNDAHVKQATPQYKYIGASDYKRVSLGRTPFTYVEEKARFEQIAEGKDVPKRLFGLPQVASTLQQGRPGTGRDVQPWSEPMNDVPDLATLSKGALNVLRQDEDGFFLMIEGGAIDWAGHANQNTRSVEETLDFDEAVQAVTEWVEKNSSWDETVLIVTADHETGYLSGPGSDPKWTLMKNKGAGNLPGVAWHSTDHTNQLVPVYFKGAAAGHWLAAAQKKDPVRGRYLDNTDLANVNFALWPEPAQR